MQMTSRATGYVEKIIRSETKVLDAKEGRVLATASTETRDRDGDIIRQAFWDLDHFMANPVLVDSHNYGSIDRIFGHWENLRVQSKALVGEVVYHLDSPNPRVSDLALQGLDLARRGMAAFSVGFIPDMAKAVELKTSDSFFPSYEFKGQELLEVSQVSVPSNPDALLRMKGLHPVLDDIIEEKLITIDDKPASTEADEEIAEAVERILGAKGWEGRLEAIEKQFPPLVKLIHTHIAVPEPDPAPDDDEPEINAINFGDLFKNAYEEARNG